VLITGDATGAMAFVRPILSAVPLVLLLSSGHARIGIAYAALYVLASGFIAASSFVGSGPVLFVMMGCAGLIRQFIPGIMMGVWLVTTTTVSEFMAACDRMHMPQAIEIPLIVMFRYFPTVASDMRQINAAMRMRGVTGSPFHAAESRLVPLLVEAVRGGDDLSAAALTRGLGSPVRRTNISQVGFGVQDGIFALLCVACLVVAVLHGIGVMP
jgi:energy-coupling factor transport system permease protein